MSIHPFDFIVNMMTISTKQILSKTMSDYKSHIQIGLQRNVHFTSLKLKLIKCRP